VRDAVDVVIAFGHHPVSVGVTANAEVTPIPAGGRPARHHNDWLLDALGWEAATVDELMLRTSCDLAGLTLALSQLRGDGLVAETGGWWERQR
ncbi:MAG: hypothetical protein P8N02_07065, partial [Actinomycetota bacterium]|nr:hypothetical protein [Actinomycetota bacterium]